MRLGWVIAYSAGLFVASVLALPCWNAFLRDSVGRFLTVEQIHVVEYAGLGGVAAFTPPHGSPAKRSSQRPRPSPVRSGVPRRAGHGAGFTCRRATRSWRRIIGLVGLVAAVGFLDEALQVFLPHRCFQWSDVLLNWLGLVVGVIVVGVTAWLSWHREDDPNIFGQRKQSRKTTGEPR